MKLSACIKSAVAFGRTRHREPSQHAPALLSHLCPPLIFGFFLVISASAQIPAPTDAPKPRTPEESAAAFKLPPGFRMEVVASEPLLASPSGIAWDERGRMFVSELHGYNLAGQLDIEELNKSGKLDTQVRRVQADAKHKLAAEKGTFGVIKLLTDTDGDGRMDKATVFATNLPPAYGLVPARGGLIVACAPHILFFADRDGDGFAEVRETLFTGFGTGELERGINAPQWGADGWIYFGRGWPGGPITGPKLAQPVTLPGSDFRIRADGSAIEPVTGNTATFGFAFTEAGDRFTVTTRNSFFVAPLPWHYLVRNPDAAASGLQVAVGDARAYSISKPHPWRQRRADDPAYSKYYRDRYGAAESDPTGWFTSACGPLLYRDHALPGLHGHYFLCEPSGNLIHRALVETDGPAVTFRRAPGEEQSEFAATSDQWSHPMHLLHGPDGAIWVVDYYREIIEDYSAIPRHLQQQYGLYAGHDRGRIYRLTHAQMPAAPAADLSKLDAKSLAAETASPLLWRRQTAQRLLVERNEKSAAPQLREVLAAARAGDFQSPSVSNENAKAAAGSRRHIEPSAVITALRTLNQLAVLTPDDLHPFVSHSAESVRVHALQLADRLFAKPESKGLLDTVLTAAAAETSPRVALQFALSLGESRDPRAFAMLARYARERLGVRWMDTAILSSLHKRGGEMLVELLREPGGSGPLLGALTKAIAASRDEAELARTLNLLASATPETQATVLDGLAKGRKNAPRQPLADKSARATLAKLAASPAATVRTATRALEDTFVPAVTEGETFTGPAVAITTEVSDATFRKFTAALNGPRDAKRGQKIFTLACATCHRIGKEGHEFGPDLLGELGVAEETLVRHLLLPNERIRPGYETTVVDTRAGASVVGLLKDDGATSLTLTQPNGAEQVLLRKDVAGVRRVAGSLMPSFAETLTPADLASLLTWLRSNLRADAGVRAVLFDEEPGFAALLNQESGTATIESTGAAFGNLCLRITPPQRASPRIPGWNFRIVERPAATNEFRYLRLSWRATGAGVMVELARSGQWPKAEDRNGRYHAGRNTTAWQSREASAVAPREWDTVTLDLWKDLGSFTLTGLAPTAMGGDAWFDRIELLR